MGGIDTILQTKEASLKTLKTILCISALLVLTASTADAYVRRHPVARGTAVAAGTAVAVGTAAAAARPWGYSVYGPGGSYAPTAVRPVGPGWGVGAQPYQASVYGQGGPYTDAPGTCYRDCDNYRKALRESGYNPKEYRTKAGTVKQTNY